MRPLRQHIVVDSPIGPLTLAASGGRLTGLYMEIQGHPPEPAALGERVDAQAAGQADACLQVLLQARSELAEYFAGTRVSFGLPLEMEGTGFQRRVWDALRAIPYGETISYGELARRIGQPSAARAVGLANGRNPVSIVVPCHRVVGASGSLTGYGGGLDRKRFLLALERRAREPVLI